MFLVSKARMSDFFMSICLDVEPHVDCEPGWTLLTETRNCYFIDVHDRAWNVAEDNCVTMGGHLVSINSPDVQTRIFQLTSKSAASGLYCEK